MTDKIRIVYEIAEAMAQTFQQSQQQVQDTMSAIQSMANQVEGGALLGLGGDALVDAMRNQLSPSLQKLADKFAELQGDVQAAIQYMQEADQTSASKF